jgi:putative hydrolase of the HAD superfamily
VFLCDLDNTLCDNDLARDRLTEATERILGPEASAAYWATYESVREAQGFVDFLGTQRRFHREHPEVPDEPLDRAILDFPYAEVRYPDSLRVIAALRRMGALAILSDGDPIFQPLKVARSGISDAVDGNVMVFAHKEQHLDDVSLLFPADRYIVIDDKAGVLARIKETWGERVGTVHVRQGKYADDPYEGPRPDATVARIGDLVGLVGTPDALQVFVEDASMRGRAIDITARRV